MSLLCVVVTRDRSHDEQVQVMVESCGGSRSEEGSSADRTPRLDSRSTDSIDHERNTVCQRGHVAQLKQGPFPAVGFALDDGEG